MEWDEIERSLQNLVKHISSQEAAVAHSARLDLAWQVAHDIRSPLTFLNIFAEKAVSIEDEERIAILQATERINKIANDLLQIRKNKNLHQPTLISTAEIHRTIKQLIQEKKIEYEKSRNIEYLLLFNEEDMSLKSPIEIDSLTRIISNILNNSIEAIERNNGIVKIEISIKNDYLSVKIEDNGKGIIPQHLDRIRHEAFTYGKSDGNGLGLHHAIKNVEKSGGRLDIESSENQGTIVKILIPVLENEKKLSPY